MDRPRPPQSISRRSQRRADFVKTPFPFSCSSGSTPPRPSPFNGEGDNIEKLIRGKIEAYLGLDVGSISTNLVVIDKEKRVLSKRYLMTAGRPIEAVRIGLQEIGEEIGDRVEIKGVGTTGSGRYLTADFVGQTWCEMRLLPRPRQPSISIQRWIPSLKSVDRTQNISASTTGW